MKTISLVLFLFMLSLGLQAQDAAEMHHLERELRKHPDDVDLLLKIAEEIHYSYPDSARALSRKAISLSKSKGFSTPLVKAYCEIGNSFFIYNKWDSATVYYQVAISISRQIHDRALEGAIHSSLGQAFIAQGHLKDANKEFILAESLLPYEPDKHNRLYYEMMIEGGYADMYTKMDVYDSALSHLNRSIIIARQIKDSNTLVLDYNAKGAIYISTRQTGNAIKFYNLALRLSQRLLNDIGTGYCYANIAEAYLNAESPDIAKKYADSAYVTLKDIEGYYVAHALTKYARIAMAHGKTDSAIYYYSAAGSLFLKGGEKIEGANSFSSLAGIYFEKKQYDEAINYIKKALPVFIDEDARKEVRDNYLLLAQINQSLDKADSALAYYQKYVVANDRFIDKERITQTEKQNVLYEVPLLEYEKEAVNSKLLVKKKQFIIVVAASVLLVLIVLVLAYQKRIINRQKQEILHNNKDYLSILIVLFRKQAEDPRYTADPGFSYLIQENRNKLTAIESLYDLLYESNRGAVNLVTYLERLCELKQDILGQPVFLQCDFDHLILPVTALSRIGLIINEMTTNAIKHAYNESPSVFISVEQTNRQIAFLIQNDGEPLPDHFDINKVRKNGGLDFVRFLVKKYNGSITARNIINGVSFEIRLSKKALRHYG